MSDRRLLLDVGLPLLASKLIVFAVTAIVLNVDPTLAHMSFVHPFNGWDSASYVKISQTGYPTCAHKPGCIDGYLTAFLPGFPFLIRFVNNVIGGDPLVAGLLVNVIAEAVALYFIYLLVQRERDRRSARFVVWAVALAPFGVFLTTVYTESTFLAAAAACLYYARGGEMGKASLAAAAACAVRLTGVCLVPVLLIEIVLRRRWKPSSLLLPCIAVAPLAVYGWYMSVHAHDAMALFDANRDYFYHSFAPPWKGFTATWAMFTGETDPSQKLTWGREIVSAVVGCIAVIGTVLWTLRRRLAPSIATYCVLAFVTATSISWWLSVGRYELAMFPILIVVADLTKRFWVLRPVFIVAGAALMIWNTSIYATGAWLS